MARAPLLASTLTRFSCLARRRTYPSRSKSIRGQLLAVNLPQNDVEGAKGCHKVCKEGPPGHKGD